MQRCGHIIYDDLNNPRLVSARDRAYLLIMKTGIRLLLPLLLLIALTGAPFGMGRMMDHAHQTIAMVDHSAMGHQGMHHGEAPADKPSTPHFMMCAACFTVAPAMGLQAETIALAERVTRLPTTILHGKSLMPDLPPPRV
jgi:hypothetical protein